jgi:hypothetical protein
VTSIVRRRRAVLVTTLAAALVLAGCGSSGSSTPAAGAADSTGTSGASGSPGSSAPPSAGSSGSTPSVVQGVTLTAQGSQLRLGQTARVTWQPQGKGVSVAALTVTRLQKVPISVFADWRLDRKTQHSTPYFVHVTVRNLGHTNLSGVVVPLYLLDQSNTLLEPSTFQASFPRCPSRPLPRSFKRGKKTSACLVYFITHHGKLQAISFRPSGDFSAITWTGRSGR